MYVDLCVCDVIPRLSTSTRVIVIMHHAEAMRQSNTGRLVPVALESGEIRLRGRPGRPLETGGLVSGDRRTLLLFPGEEAEDLGPDLLERDPRPVTLVVPDGSWNHARKVSYRVPALRRVEQVRIPYTGGSTYALRRQPRRDKLATLEAVARALGIIEDEGIGRQLEVLFHVAVDRILWARGRLEANRVRGGLPPNLVRP